jgi:hypothetical protein
LDEPGHDGLAHHQCTGLTVLIRAMGKVALAAVPLSGSVLLFAGGSAVCPATPSAKHIAQQRHIALRIFIPMVTAMATKVQPRNQSNT